MIAGKLKYLIELQRPEHQTGAFGSISAKPDFVPTRRVRAGRVKLSGQSRMSAYERFSDFNAIYEIRDAHTVDNGWRVQEIGGHLYTVCAVEPNRERGMLILICKRVNAL